MKNKKWIWLPVCLILVCVVSMGLILVACNPAEDPAEPTVTEAPTEVQDETTEATDIPEETQPQVTEATESEETEPEETEPEETEPTEPEETQAPGNSGGNNLNTGTGGGYNPGETTEPTEPGDVTEPEIEVPAAGSENNAYYEQIKDGFGGFSTVKIPAGSTMHYRIKTSGSFLRLETETASVVYDGKTYAPENGLIQLELPADDTAPLALQFVNNGAEDQQFAVAIQDAVGSLTNPIVLDSLEKVAISLEEDDLDGNYYSWIADQTGELKLILSGDAADVNISLNGEPAQLTETENGDLCLQVAQNDEILIQVQAVADAEGKVPAAEVVLDGYVVQTVELKVSRIPVEVETVTIFAGRSVFYKITGAANKQLEVTAENISVIYNDSVLTPDENGVLRLTLEASPALVEIKNTGDADTTYTLKFNYTLGHRQNPHILTQLGELPTAFDANQDGYYYNYTAAGDGIVTFQLWTYPELEDVKTNITVTNETTGESTSLWTTDESGKEVENETASVSVTEGDKLSIHVTAKNAAGRNVAAEFIIYGELYGSEELPIPVMYPGFTANVPAGKTMYYEGYNMSGLILTLTGENVKVGHNGVEYVPASGKITFTVTAEGRNPAVFAITNNADQNASYKVTFAYPLGHAENPARLLLGTNTLTQKAGATDYYYIFTAPRAGTLTLHFDPAAQWVYAVDNLTQEIYNDTQWSDSDPLVAETTIAVKARDLVRVRVNTYDPANMFEAPAGTVVFEAKYVNGPTTINSLTTPTNINLLPGEYGAYIGQFYDHTLTIGGAKNLVVNINGTDYYADATGVITVDMPASDGSGTQPDLMFTVQNMGNANVTRSMLFSTKNVGSKENPDKMQYGPNVMTQTQKNGADYYYTFTVTANGKFTVSFDENADWLYQLTNVTRNQTSGLQLSTTGVSSYQLTVRKGDVIELVVNTFDSKTGGSPAGTVEFTVAPA